MAPARTRLSIAERDFRPVPADQRVTPARIGSASARLYITKLVEHREAFQFIQDREALAHGEGTRTIVRALIHYRDTVIGSNGSLLDEAVALRAFRPLPRDQRPAKDVIKGVSARLRIDQYVEHREAFNFFQDMQDMHGDGGKTLVKALLHYRDTIIRPMEEQETQRQLTLDTGLRPVTR